MRIVAKDNYKLQLGVDLIPAALETFSLGYFHHVCVDQAKAALDCC